MPLALFLIMSTTVIAVTAVSILTYQVAQTRNEQLVREAQLAVDTTMNLAAETLGASGRALLGVPIEEPEDWVESEITGVATKWWTIPLNLKDIARTVTPTPFTYTASSGEFAASIDVNNDIYLTSDGISWVQTGESPVPTDDISDFTYGRGNFIITARPNSDEPLGSIVYYSSNGKDWKAAATFGTDEDSVEKFARVACSGTLCAMITGAPEERTRYWLSSDLASWTLTADTEEDAAAKARDIAYGANRWVAIGHNGTTNETSVSTDGSTWSNAEDAHAGGAADPVTQFEYASATGFVGVYAGLDNTIFYPSYSDNFGSTPASSSVVYSEDATSWSTSILPIAQHWTNLASDGSSLFLIAESSQESAMSGTPVALSTEDPSHWQTRSLPRSGNYTTVAPVASSWLISTPLSNYAYLAGSAANRPTLPTQIYLKSVATTTVNSVDTTFNKVYRFQWSDLRNRWELEKTYTDLEFDLEASFNITPSDGRVLLEDSEADFAFADTTAGSPTSWNWDFGDGTTSTSQNPAKTYTESGTYTVRLTVTEPGGYSSTYSEIVRVQTVPTTPRAVQVSPSNSGLKLQWSAPISNGQSPIYEYLIRYREVGTTTWDTVTIGSLYEETISDLTGREAYEAQIAARNDIGVSEWSPLGSAEALQPPTAPENLTIDGLVDMAISFDVPVEDGGLPISGYRVQSATDTEFTNNVETIDIRNTNALIRYFDEYTTYYLRVFGLNNAGVGEPTEYQEFTTIGRPEVPESTSTEAVDDQIEISWSAPLDDGGSEVTGYQVEYTTVENDYDAGTRITTVDEEFSFPSDPGVTYYVRVSAISAAGVGDVSEEMSATGNSVVQALPGLVTSGQSESVYIDWDTPSDAESGGSAIQSYTLTWTSFNGVANSATFSGATTAILVDQEDTTGDGLADSPLTPGNLYSFNLTVTNGVGNANFGLSGTPTS
jgi:PKD repeat protein